MADEYGATPNYNLRFPKDGAKIDTAGDIQRLAEDVDAALLDKADDSALPLIIYGTGRPDTETSLNDAPVGVQYIFTGDQTQLDAVFGARVWRKTPTGWVCVEGETGTYLTSEGIYIQRTDRTVYAHMRVYSYQHVVNSFLNFGWGNSVRLAGKRAGSASLVQGNTYIGGDKDMVVSEETADQRYKSKLEWTSIKTDQDDGYRSTVSFVWTSNVFWPSAEPDSGAYRIDTPEGLERYIEDISRDDSPLVVDDVERVLCE